jgi:hypothetical protein
MTKKNVYVNMCLVLGCDRVEPFESPDITPLDFCWWGWMKSEVKKENGIQNDELLGPVLNAALI